MSESIFGAPVEPAELKAWREAQGKMLQRELAPMLETHVMTVSRWEYGAVEPPRWLRLALAEIERRRKGKRGKADAKTE